MMHRRKFFKAAASVAFVTGVGGVTVALGAAGPGTTLTAAQILAFEQASGLRFVPQPGASFVPVACEIRTCIADIDIMGVLGETFEYGLSDPALEANTGASNFSTQFSGASLTIEPDPGDPGWTVYAFRLHIG